MPNPKKTNNEYELDKSELRKGVIDCLFKLMILSLDRLFEILCFLYETIYIENRRRIRNLNLNFTNEKKNALKHTKIQVKC